MDSNKSFCICSYNERVSKNHHASLKRCQEEQFRPPVICYSPDVVQTWKAYSDHLADDMKQGYLFLTPNDRYTSKVWYTRSRVGLKTISGMMKKMAEEAGVDGKVTNKTGIHTSISKMAMAGAPRDIMCAITGAPELCFITSLY